MKGPIMRNIQEAVNREASKWSDDTTLSFVRERRVQLLSPAATCVTPTGHVRFTGKVDFEEFIFLSNKKSRTRWFLLNGFNVLEKDFGEVRNSKEDGLNRVESTAATGQCRF